MIEPATFDAILADVSAGEPVRQAIVANGADTKGFYRLISSDDEAGKRYARAKLAGLERMADEIIEIADDASQDIETRVNASGEEYNATNQEVIARSRLRVDSRKWILSKLVPKKYGDKLAVGGDADMPAVQVLARVERVIVRPPN